MEATMFEILREIGAVELHAWNDPATGVRALVAIHDTRLGPAVGGCRVHAYAGEDEAVWDVVRLARAMTAKAALARLPHGGGKAVIWTQPGTPIADRRAFFTSFARFVHGLGGRYLTCEDSGTSAGDMDVIREATPYCLGFSVDKGGSGDPSPFTALGVRRGIEACAEAILGRADVRGLHVAVQGVGHVGAHLCRELAQAGCRLTIADVVPRSAERVARETGAAIVPIDAIFDVDCDVFAPCALGGAINDATVGRLRCRVVAGAANNQLASREVGRALHARGIFYAPDYAINAGGLINVAEEHKGYDAGAARHKVLAIHETLLEIARRSGKSGTPPGEIADKMVEEILAAAGQARPELAWLRPSPDARLARD